jgi:hypothetical protein
VQTKGLEPSTPARAKVQTITRRDLERRFDARSLILRLIGLLVRTANADWPYFELFTGAAAYRCPAASACRRRGPDGTQHLLPRAVWDTEGVRDDLRDYVVEYPGMRARCWWLMRLVMRRRDRDGRHPAPVHQYHRPGGKRSGHGISDPRGARWARIIDSELSLPRSWISGPARCAGARIPEDVEFATKLALARAVIRGTIEEVPRLTRAWPGSTNTNSAAGWPGDAGPCSRCSRTFCSRSSLPPNGTPPQPRLIALTCNEIRHLFTKLITEPHPPAHRYTDLVTLATPPSTPCPRLPLPQTKSLERLISGLPLGAFRASREQCDPQYPPVPVGLRNGRRPIPSALPFSALAMSKTYRVLESFASAKIRSR